MYVGTLIKDETDIITDQVCKKHSGKKARELTKKKVFHLNSFLILNQIDSLQ